MASTTSTTLSPFSPAITLAIVEANTTSFLSEHNIKTTLLRIAEYILSISTYSTLFGKHKSNPYDPSVATLFTRLVSGMEGVSPLEHIRKDSERVKAEVVKKYGSGTSTKLTALRASAASTDIFQDSDTSKAVRRPLADFEDLYYALLARMHDLSHHLSVRLHSSFNTSSDPVYPSGPSIADFHTTLLSFWDTLNGADLVTPLHNSVRRARLAAMRADVVRAAVADLITAEEAEQHLTDLDAPGAHKAVDGMMWVGQLAPGMIGALLTERWRVRFAAEKAVVRQAEKEARETARKAMDAARKVKRDRRSAELKLTGQKRAVRPSAKALWKAVEVMQKREAKANAVKKEDGLARDFGKMAISEAPQQVAVTQNIVVDQGGPVQVHAPIPPQTNIIDPVVMYNNTNLDWEFKTRRVSAYSQYLRSLASQRARTLVQTTRLDNAALFEMSRGSSEDDGVMEF